MNKKLMLAITVALLLVAIVLPGLASAKGGSFGGARASVRVSSPATRSSSSPKSSSTQTIKVSRDNVMSSLRSGKGAKGDAAAILVKDFQTRNASPIKPNSKISVADLDKTFSSNYRNNRRQDFYGTYTSVRPVHYTQTVQSSYGPWDVLMFDSFMDNVGDRQMYYHHQDDPNFTKWRSDANAACVAGDQDVCEKLRDLDKEMDEYKAKGIAKNPKYITQGVDPDIYEASNIDPKTLPSLKICTGPVGSDYARYAMLISKVTKLKVEQVEANGSADALSKLASGACDLAWVQNDLITGNNLTKIVTLNQLEVGLLVCPKASGVKVVSDFTDKHKILAGSDQTGSQFTLDRLREKVSALARPQIDNSKSVLEAAKVAPDSNACVFAVSTPDFIAFRNLDNSGKSNIVPIVPSDFIDKKATYNTVKVDDKHYKNLTQEIYKSGWFTIGGTNTISVQTSLVTSQSWSDQNKQLSDLLLIESLNLQTSLQ